jgi:aerobic C4-dicarboxylate transport protein
VASGLPVEGLALLLGVDRFMSQGRSVVNVIGNAVAAVAVARWDDEFDAQRWKATSPSLPSAPALDAIQDETLPDYAPSLPGKSA